MRWREQFGEDATAVAAIGELLVNGRMAAALRAAERLARAATNRYARAQAQLLRVCALVNLGRTTQYAAAIDEAFGALRGLPEPYPHGHLHALAALAAHQRGAPERSLTHLVHSARALDAVGGADRDLAWGWHDLAMAYSYLGFHAQAMRAIARARELGARTEVPAVRFAQPGIRLRMALSMDHHGDADGCLRVLRDLTTELDRHPREALRPSDRVGYGYALARQAALGAPVRQAARPLLVAGAEGQRPRDMWRLGEVCLMIASGKATDALARLDAVTVSADALGPAEPARLRSLSLAASGDHTAAHQADRHAFRIATQGVNRLREMVLDGIAARLDQDDVRRTIARHHRERLTDPLTGLANQQHFDHYLAAMASRGEQAMVGVAKLGGLATVNETHGRLSGDLVWQRVAGVVARVLRSGDFVARRDGDELAVVLPHASPDQAAHVGERLTAAVAAEDWSSLVPGTAVSLQVSWNPS